MNLQAFLDRKDAERTLFYCPCCRDRYPQEDMDLANDWLHSEAMRARYGAACCKQCTDDHILTADAVVMPKADAVSDGYDYWSSEDALADAICEAGNW